MTVKPGCLKYHRGFNAPSREKETPRDITVISINVKERQSKEEINQMSELEIEGNNV